MPSPSCETRLPAHLESRLSTFGAAQDLATAADVVDILQSLEDRATRELFCEIATR